MRGVLVAEEDNIKEEAHKEEEKPIDEEKTIDETYQKQLQNILLI